MARAIQFTEYGDPDVLQLVDVLTPEPGEGQVRVAVRAVGVNAYDWKVRSGAYSDGTPLAGPTRTGLDFAGVVDALGSGVEGLEVGQAVLGKAPGAAATHVAADAAGLVPRPDSLSFELAAALPTPTETAVRSLRLLDPKPGTLLIHAAAGGVGLVAAQLARSRGLTVIGTASDPNHAFLREIGVVPVTYGDGLVERVRAVAPQGVDAVLDASGRGVLPDSIELAGGPERVVTIADFQGAEYGVRVTGGGADSVPMREAFAEVLPLLERGELKVPIEHVFPLDRAAEAHRVSQTGHLRGRIVLTVD